MAVPHFLHDSLLLDGHDVAAVCDDLRASGPALATEATGWPAMTLWVVPTPDPAGTRLALFSSRHPGFDLSTGRVDKVWRNRIARAAVRAFLVNLGGALQSAPPVATPSRAAATYVSA